VFVHKGQHFFSCELISTTTLVCGYIRSSAAERKIGLGENATLGTPILVLCRGEAKWQIQDFMMGKNIIKIAPNLHQMPVNIGNLPSKIDPREARKNFFDYFFKILSGFFFKMFKKLQNQSKNTRFMIQNH